MRFMLNVYVLYVFYCVSSHSHVFCYIGCVYVMFYLFVTLSQFCFMYTVTVKFSITINKS